MRDNEPRNFPLVTIGIPNYNYAHYIIEAIESAVNQDYSNIELIIVDDCSMDNSVEVIEEWIKNYKGKFKIEFIKQNQNRGLTNICNQILNKAKGIYLQILDADDIFKKEKISSQVAIMNAEENTALVYSNMFLMEVSGKLMEGDYLKRIKYDENKMPQGRIFHELFDFNFIAYPLINVKLAKEVGGFDESQQVHDYYLWLKLAQKYEIRYCPGKYAFYRIHGNSMSNNTSTNVRSIENVLTTKYRYFQEGDGVVKKIVKRDIFNSVTTLYEKKFPTAGMWLKRNFKYNPGIKSLMYYTAYSLGVPFGFFSFLKRTSQALKK